MVKIKPFSGLYYYNKYSKANNVSKFVKSALDFDVSGFGADDQNDLNVAVLQNFNMPNEVTENLKNWLEGGVLTVSGGLAFYVCEMSYKISDRAYVARGFFAVVDLAETGGFKIEKLDHATEDSAKLVSNLLQKVNFQTSSIFTLYDDKTHEISSVLKDMCVGQCFERAKHFNVSYKVWEVTDSAAIERLQSKFEQIENLYLVGGSVVYDAVLANSQEKGASSCALTFFMDRSSEALAVLPFNRVVSMSMFDLDESLSRLSSNFEFIACDNLKLMRNKMFGLRCEGKRAFGIYAEETFGVLVYLNNFDGEKVDEKNELDAFVVDEIILKELMGLSGDCSVQYASLASAAKMAVDNGDGCFAIFLNSPRLEELVEVAESKKAVATKPGQVFPRPVDGLVFYSFES